MGDFKICNCCKIKLPLDNFYKNRNTTLGQCKNCCYTKEKKYRASNQGAVSKRNSTLLRKYKIDFNTYENMLESQNGQCLICKSNIQLFGSKSTVAHVDHCHNTGRVRGLLCNYCNSVIGVYNEDVEIFKRAINYLKD